MSSKSDDGGDGGGGVDDVMSYSCSDTLPMLAKGNFVLAAAAVKRIAWDMVFATVEEGTVVVAAVAGSIAAVSEHSLAVLEADMPLEAARSGSSCAEAELVALVMEHAALVAYRLAGMTMAVAGDLRARLVGMEAGLIERIGKVVVELVCCEGGWRSSRSLPWWMEWSRWNGLVGIASKIVLGTATGCKSLEGVKNFEDMMMPLYCRGSCGIWNIIE